MVFQMVCWWRCALPSLYKFSSVTETQLMVLVESESSILFTCVIKVVKRIYNQSSPDVKWRENLRFTHHLAFCECW